MSHKLHFSDKKLFSPNSCPNNGFIESFLTSPHNLCLKKKIEGSMYTPEKKKIKIKKNVYHKRSIIGVFHEWTCYRNGTGEILWKGTYQFG